MEIVFQMCWRQHGGSGLGFTLSEVDDLFVSDLHWYLERVDKQRSAEARELEKAAKG